MTKQDYYDIIYVAIVAWAVLHAFSAVNTCA